ncbi:phage tail protein [Rahnella sp. ChDrAdgB13]|uniref:phage tail-collar fiber domain-containing protein n=1 Tax=Rahnella sp. ChDrAdgB13 TaxID=1850581 RepID=UPI001AD89AB4|nr:phage tail protein [Rahnella sp. ChDrAdgB13]
MSQTVITQAFVEWKAQQAADNQPVTLDEFIFAFVPDLDVTKPIENTEAIPTDKIVYRQAVSKTGVVNANAVVYSVTMGADVGDFDFNWIGLTNKASGTLAMIIHAPTQRKIQNASGQQGNVLVRSMLMEYSGAQASTNITTPAETWQIDFTARLAGMDEADRLAALDIYGAGAFFDNGFLVAKTGSQYFVTKGLGYVGGLRAELAANQNVAVSAKPTTVWADVCYQGTLTSAYKTAITFTVADTLENHTTDGVAHYVFALASIDAAGTITDLRPKGSLADQTFLRKDKNLTDIANPATALKTLNGVPTSRTVNKKPLSDDINLAPDDVGALPSGGTAVAAKKLETTRKIAGVEFDGTKDISLTGANIGLDKVGNYAAVQANGGLHHDSAHRIYMDWAIDGKIYATVDNTDQGAFFTTKNPPNYGQVGAYPQSGGNVSGYVNATYLSATQPPNPGKEVQGTFIGWNETGGQGESDFINNRGGGVGGFHFRTVNSNNSEQSGYINFSGTGDISAQGDINTDTGGIFEKGQRVYSPNNPQPNIVQDMRFGTSAEFQERSNNEHVDGGVMTSFKDSGSSNYWIRVRQLQKLINNTWYTVSYT